MQCLVQLKVFSCYIESSSLLPLRVNGGNLKAEQYVCVDKYWVEQTVTEKYFIPNCTVKLKNILGLICYCCSHVCLINFHLGITPFELILVAHFLRSILWTALLNKDIPMKTWKNFKKKKVMICFWTTNFGAKTY